MLKIKANSASYKKLIGAAAALVNKATSNPNEKCLHLVGKDGQLFVTACSNSAHKITLVEGVEVTNPGFVFIDADTVQSMTKSLPPDSGDLEISVSNKAQLTYRINGLGAIAENIFSNQDAFKGIVFGEDKFQALTQGCTQLASVISMIGAVCNSYSDIWISFSQEAISVYGQFSESGFVKYTFEQANGAEFNAYFKHPTLKAVNGLGDALTIQYNPVTKGLMFEGSGGTLIQNGSATKTSEFEGVDFVKEQDPAGKVVVKYAELTKAVQWHSYGAQTGDGITLSFANEKLKVQGRRIEEAAEIATEDGSETFGSITLPMQGLASALKGVQADFIVISTIVISLGTEQQIRVALFEPWDSAISASAILYEQLKLNK